MLLGAIGDDFTGSADLGNTLVKAGMRTVQYVGVPDGAAENDVEAGIVALKTRSMPVEKAVEQSLRALDWLREQGCRQFVFKYCSTFDSTAQGNIGPVAKALADRLEAETVVFCPAFPANGRTVYRGHLFVGDRLLSESGMENHPLTPMRDPDLRRWLGHQLDEPVGLVTMDDIRIGAERVRAVLNREKQAGRRMIVADAIADEDLLTLASALTEARLITGGSGIALGLPANFDRRGLLSGTASDWSGQSGPAAILSGSCSAMTLKQVKRHGEDHPSRAIDPEAVLAGHASAEEMAAWCLSEGGLPLVYSSSSPERLQRLQKKHGRQALADALDAYFAEIARHLVKGGVKRLVTAGGETSGAVVEGLGLGRLQIGPEIDPGVPAIRASDDLVLALKSGNFGGEDFFARAAALLEGAS